MSKQMRGLGRGLDSLIRPGMHNNLNDSQNEIRSLNINEIDANQFQPRKDFDEEALEELMQSIKQYGILQPILVRKTMSGYELIAGERRLRASKQAGLRVIPAIIREFSDSEMTEIALIENLQREDLTPIEEAIAYNKLIVDFGLTQEEIAKKVGRSRSHIANFIRLLNLPKIIQDYVSRGTISMGQAKPLISLEDETLQLEAAEFIISEDLSARASEELVKKMTIKPTCLKERENNESQTKEIFVVEAEDRLKIILGTQVKIRPGKIKSKIEIEFYSAEDLDRIVDTMTQHADKLMTHRNSSFVV